MRLDKEELASMLKRRLMSSNDFSEALEIARINSSGKIWLAGGMVSRVLIREIYDAGHVECDYDFLLERLNDELVVPQGWSVERKKFGNPTFRKGSLEVDLLPLGTHDHIKSNKLDVTIENFFKGTPYAIQAMAYDVDRCELVGDVGIDALRKREYAVNNYEQAKRSADSKGISVNDRIKKKAESLGLKPVFIEP
ncbi:hypothetical protein JW826_02110 [Candidatus Woesearchaeota archaeon]|nr:hypothetical protein [Candidatus Woesearchaeota archaeon]